MLAIIIIFLYVVFARWIWIWLHSCIAKPSVYDIKCCTLIWQMILCLLVIFWIFLLLVKNDKYMFWSYIFCLSKMCVRKGCPFQQDYRKVLEEWPMTTSWSRPLTPLPKSPPLPRRSRLHMTRSLRNCRRPRKEDRYQSPNAVGLERNLSPCHPSQFAFLKCMPNCDTCTTLLHEYCYVLIAQVKRYTRTTMKKLLNRKKPRYIFNCVILSVRICRLYNMVLFKCNALPVPSGTDRYL